jgi:hypothetical protein
LGDTVEAVLSDFRVVRSIELKPEFFVNAQTRFEPWPHVRILHGDSSITLYEAINDLDNVNIVFFLDGHWSGGGTARGRKDCPLMEELKVIANRGRPDVIIIDDQPMFGVHGNEDWTDITESNILRLFYFERRRVLNHFVLAGRFCLFLGEQQ